MPGIYKVTILNNFLAFLASFYTFLSFLPAGMGFELATSQSLLVRLPQYHGP